MAKLWKYSIGILLTAAAIGSAGYYHHQKLQATTQQALKNSLNSILTGKRDINKDGLEDICFILPELEGEPGRRLVCAIDYNGDCVQDLVYGFANVEGDFSQVVKIDYGQSNSGRCHQMQRNIF